MSDPNAPLPAAPASPPNWYPDPWGRHEHRWFDGAQWTDQVSSHGRQSTDPPVGAAHVPTVDRGADKVQRDVRRAGIEGVQTGGGGSLFTESILVVNQTAKLIEVNSEYAIFDANGRQIGAARQVGQSAAKKALRVLSNLDQFMTHKLQIVDADGRVALSLTRPGAVFKSKVLVEGGDGRPVGAIVQQNILGKIRFALEAADGQVVGSLNGENWRSWDFNIRDSAEREVARVTKTWEGLAKAMFTSADNYVVKIHEQLPQPLHSLVVASAVAIDTALKQSSN
ncbi:MAG: phospholipid scramblase-related protein [Microthrixaceae bacterium]